MAETAAAMPAFREASRRVRRCLVPLNEAWTASRDAPMHTRSSIFSLAGQTGQRRCIIFRHKMKTKGDENGRAEQQFRGRPVAPVQKTENRRRDQRQVVEGEECRGRCQRQQAGPPKLSNLVPGPGERKLLSL